MGKSEISKINRSYESFEDYAKDNGGPFWLASDLMKMLGYKDFNSFKKAINKAIGVCSTLDISIEDHFQQIKSEEGKYKVSNYRLTRFACYLTSMNADVRKPQVAAAQTYFISLAEAFRKYIQEAEDVERVYIRGEVTQKVSTLSGAAKEAGVVDYALFQNAGYRGMYNMNLRKLEDYKGLKLKPSKTILDYMGKEELAANLFRFTQTEAKIRREDIIGQKPLERVASEVGKKVRETMIEISGQKPEDLPVAEDITKIRSELKKTQKEFKKLDKSKRKQTPKEKRN